MAGGTSHPACRNPRGIIYHMLDTISKLGTTGEHRVQALLAAVEIGMMELVASSSRDKLGYTEDAGAASASHLATGGQRVRARLALSAAAANGVDEPTAIRLAIAAELFHNASLVQDDLQDRSRLRRGMPATWARYGDDVAMCSGDLMLSAGYCALAGIADRRRLPALLGCAHRQISRAILGQCADRRAGGIGAVAWDHYEEIAAAKSGALLSLPLELALITADLDDYSAQARDAANSFAVGYQIVDDLVDEAEDRDNGESGPGLNAVLILAPEWGRDAVLEAGRRAVHCLRAASDIAARLPNGSGHLLGALVHALEARASERTGA